MTWPEVVRELMKLIVPWKGKLTLTFMFGVLRVAGFIGVGVLSALVILALKTDQPFTGYLWGLAVVAPLAGVLHWLESWMAHDMAFRQPRIPDETSRVALAGPNSAPRIPIVVRCEKPTRACRPP